MAYPHLGSARSWVTSTSPSSRAFSENERFQGFTIPVIIDHFCQQKRPRKRDHYMRCPRASLRLPFLQHVKAWLARRAGARSAPLRAGHTHPGVGWAPRGRSRPSRRRLGHGRKVTPVPAPVGPRAEGHAHPGAGWGPRNRTHPSRRGWAARQDAPVPAPVGPRAACAGMACVGMGGSRPSRRWLWMLLLRRLLVYFREQVGGEVAFAGVG